MLEDNADDDEASDHSSTSMAAMQNKKHVSPKLGAHKQQVAALKKPAIDEAKEAEAVIKKPAKDTKKAEAEAEAMSVTTDGLKLSLQSRNKPGREESILYVNGKYTAQCSKTQSSKYVDIMKQTKSEIEDGKLKPDGEAVRERRERL